MTDWLRNFTAESNRIEGILREPTADEIDALEAFIELPKIAIGDLSSLVTVLQPGAVIRDRIGLNVRVVDHIAPMGGKLILEDLMTLLARANKAPGIHHPWTLHVDYETLHPFTDGNGRSGRALWLWMMLRLGVHHAEQAKYLGFLHAFYYQTLGQGRRG